MKATQSFIRPAGHRGAPIVKTVAAILALLFVTLVSTIAAPSVRLWDTAKPLKPGEAQSNRADWVAIPNELFAHEADPIKSASDPGYYGREYIFKGDAVVENASVCAVFSTASGSVTLYAPSDATGKGAFAAARKIAEISPVTANAGETLTFQRFSILRNAGDEVTIGVSFAAKSGAAAAHFSLGRNEIVELKAQAGLKGFRVAGPLAYGIVPSFIGDDLIYSPASYPTAGSIALPPENMFVGLQPGGDRMLVVTWPKGQQQLKLELGSAGDKRTIEAIELRGDGQAFYLAGLTAPGLWHREEMKATFLEKEVPLTWQRPFPAKWKTQLSESGVKTTYAFRQAKGTVWRGVPGSYNYPARFDGETAVLSLGKKVPPKGEALIYALEPRETPASVLTPIDILKSTLGRPAAEAVVDPIGRKLRTHHRRGGDGVHRACTCGCTEAIEAVFKAKEECSKKEFIGEAIEDMIFFVRCHVDRIAEYQKFADATLKNLRAKAQADSELKPYIEGLDQTLAQIPTEIEAQKENMKSLDYAAELSKQTMALTAKDSPDNLKTYQALLKAWRGMGGSQDYVLAKCHTVVRQLFQEAGYGCAETPKAVALAEDLRAACRQVLRNADGYEIWSDY
jgi:hypothetical protein